MVDSEWRQHSEASSGHKNNDGIMSPSPHSLSSLRMILIAALLVASHPLAIIPSADAFSATERMPPSHFPPPWSSSRMVRSSSSSGGVATRASLRDLLDSSDGGDDENSERRDEVLDPRPDNDVRRNLINFSRSKFSDTKFRTRDVYGTGSDDEGGLHKDRLSTFSFSSNNPRSSSEGGPSSLDEEEDEFKIGGGSEEEDNYEVEDLSDGVSQEGIVGVSPSEVENALNSLGVEEDEFDSDDYNKHLNSHMVGINYSRKKQFPARTKGRISDEEDQMGLHKDRLSTFSFSDNQPALKKLTQQTLAEDGEEDYDDNSAPAGAGTNESLDDPSFAVDNFHNNINIDMSRSKLGSLADRAYRAAKTDLPEGQTNHQDRLSTFSLSSKEEKEGKPLEALQQSSGEDKEEDVGTNVSLDGSFAVDNFHNNINIDKSKTKLGDLASRSTKIDLPEGQTNHADWLSTFSLSSKEEKEVQSPEGSGGRVVDESLPRDVSDYDHRLGTFSFASGNTATKNTNPSSPLLSKDDFKNVDESDSDSSNSADRIKVYTPPQKKGSLASIASSVSIKTRNDRIKDVRIRTDPKLLHPDGMNTPRLNSKGDVMSSSTFGGRPTIFQRIEQANAQESEEGGAEEGGSGNKDVEEGANDGKGSAGDDLKNEESRSSIESSVGDNLENGDCFVGFDLGTSGARMSIVEKKTSSGDEVAPKWVYEEVFTSSLKWDDTLKYDDARDWVTAIDALLLRAQGPVLSKVKAICVSGTSATCLLAERDSLEVSRPARMYNFDVSASDDSERVKAVTELIDRFVPEKHTARANTGSLAKLLLWIQEKSIVNDDGEAREVLCHQSDYVSMSLMHEGLEKDKACAVTSDWHNCLKLGYDVKTREFPQWMLDLLKVGCDIQKPESVLPTRVVSPGEPFGVISPTVASRYGLSSNVVLVGGTTDSNAAFFAAAGAQPEAGTAVTSLGSTLAIKMLSSRFVEDAGRGVYSHRFPKFGSVENDEEEDALWLIGGASNVGCAVLRQEGFSDEELIRLSAEIDPESDSPLSYYPLTKRGERFPTADSSKEPVLEPKPESRKEYLHAILQGIGDVEREGFRVLGELGASPRTPTAVWSCGGGSRNDAWIAMRERRLREVFGDDDGAAEVRRAENTEASYGAALLAAASFED